MELWYKVKKNVLELMDFLIDAELLTDKDEIIDFVNYPQNYSPVWSLYQKHIMGIM